LSEEAVGSDDLTSSLPNNLRLNMTTTGLPVLFVSHGGGPWPYMDEMRRHFALTLAEFGKLPNRLPARPKAILVVTAHWETTNLRVSTAEQPAMLYDYSGFPPHTYQIKYPAPGSPALAGRVMDLLEQAGLPCHADDERGFDHGTFVPLGLMFPAADVPVVMLSIKSSYDPSEHVRVGQALAALRDEGVLIVGSGLTYHNMRGFGRPESTPVANQFEAYLNQAITNPNPTSRNDMLIHWAQAPGARLAHPQEDHLLPLMVVAGAAGADVGSRIFVDQVMSVAMASYWFGQLL
jgi:aromatic ring-opening dioxygenase catalytic subunit (LigB family)